MNLRLLDGDVICAQITPPGRGGVSLIRVSGNSCREVVGKVVALPENLESHRVYYTNSIDPLSQERIDEVLITFFKRGSSFTGEETFEISCHGNPVIVAQILRLLVKQGARIAEKGEFTYRAFSNGRIDLVQAESILSLINGKTERSTRMALKQLEGSFSKHLTKMEEKLSWCLAHLEANIDFSLENLETVDTESIRAELGSFSTEVENALQGFSKGRKVYEGIRVALIGPPNAGKSSLLNRVLDRERALVSEIPGTTRDIIEGEIQIQGTLVTFVDTAGIRESLDQVEKMGIARTHSEVEKSDLKVVVIEPATLAKTSDMESVGKYAQDALVLINKADLIVSEDGSRKLLDEVKRNFPLAAGVALSSTVVEEGTKEFLRFLEKFIENEAFVEAGTVFQNRQYEGLRAVRDSVKRGMVALESGLGSELIAVDLHEGLRHLYEISGKVHDEAVLDRVFKEFCIGK